MLFSWRDCSSFTRLWPLTLLERKKSPWFNLWQYGLITCELLILPPLEEIFSPPKWELIFKADGNPLSANMWFIITIDKTWRDMTAVHVMGTHPKAFHMIHSQPANCRSLTDSFPGNHQRSSAHWSSARCGLQHSCYHDRCAALTIGWMKDDNSVKLFLTSLKKKDEKLIRLHPKLILWGE